NKIRGFKSFRITLDSAVIIEDNSKTHFHVFLVPSAGFNEINELHERLYQGEMKSELRHDIPFVPHITVGSGSREDMAALVNKINESNISINGNVDQVSIVSFDGVEVKDIAKLSLA
ncbi:MAG: 2'-5' RNA ligase family protein, partial [Acidimicrobiia bacterium]